ncbi:MAG: acyl carrier protein [Lachnospiraceae bacterium]|nr:acyl carrier protein [Lachnospiraceae bacterium]
MYFDSIAKIVSERTGCDVSSIKPESKFSELGIDSLDTVELLMNLEDEIGIEIELEEEPVNTLTLSRYRKVALRLKSTLEEYSQLFQGSYLTNYSWGETTLGGLLSNQK